MKKLFLIMFILIGSFISIYSMGLNAEEKMKIKKENKIADTNEVIEEVVKEDETFEKLVEEKVEKEIQQSNTILEVKEEARAINNNISNNTAESNNEIKIVSTQNESITEEKQVEEKPIEQSVPQQVDPVVSKEENIVVEKDVVEYKINQEMINKIKNVITNNESNDMKNYGYSIVIDETIVEITNQFTFTEKRVKDKITWKFGTIKIYARDYYVNGNYVWTECYII